MKLKKATRAALGALANALPAVEPERFKMNCWLAHTGGPVLSCGFAGCAIGWGLYLGTFAPLGLTTSEAGIPYFAKTGTTGVDAVRDALSIPRDHVQWLFTPDTYISVSVNDASYVKAIQTVSTSQVARRIKKYLRDHT